MTINWEGADTQRSRALLTRLNIPTVSFSRSLPHVASFVTCDSVEHHILSQLVYPEHKACDATAQLIDTTCDSQLSAFDNRFNVTLKL